MINSIFTREPICRISKKTAPVLLLLAFIFIYFSKILLLMNTKFIGGLDVINAFYWYFQFIKDQFLSFSIPLWNPYMGSGMPFVPNPSFYPSTLLFIFLPLPLAFSIDAVLHIIIAAMGMYFLLLHITGSRSAGIASALIYGLNGYFVGRLYGGHVLHVHSAALLPWIFYFIENAIEKRRSIYFIGSGVLLGIQILTGDLQDSYYFALVLTIYTFCRYLFLPREDGKSNPFRFSGFYLLIPLFSFGISAIQLIPAWECLQLSDRGMTSYQFASYMSFPFRNFLTFLIPFPKSSGIEIDVEYMGYFGILPLVLAVIGLIFSKPRTYKWCFGIIAVFSVTFMLGAETPIYHVYYKVLPLLSSFRVPARFLLIFVFSMSVLAGMGLQLLYENRLSVKQYGVITALIFSLAAAISAGAASFQIPFLSKQILFAIFQLAASFTLISFLLIHSGKKVIVASLILTAFLDLHIALSSKIPLLNIEDFSRQTEYEKFIKKDSDYGRVILPFEAGAARSMGHQYYDANGDTGAFLADYFHFMHYMGGVPPFEMRRHTLSPDLFIREKIFSSRILGIKYALIPEGGRFQLIAPTDPPMPRAVLIRNAIFTEKPEDHLRFLKSPDFDPRQKILLVSSDRKFGFQETSCNEKEKDEVTVTRYLPNRIELKSFSPADSYLLISEIFYPGWKARVDGVDAPVLKADYLLRAVPLAAGSHEIVIDFSPSSFMAGAVITLSTIFGLILIGLYKLRNRRKA